MSKKQWSLIIAGFLIVGIIVSISYIYNYKSEIQRIYKNIVDKQDQVVFQIDNHIFTYRDWDNLNKYNEALVIQGNKYTSDNPKLAIIDAFYLTLYEIDATAREIDYQLNGDDFTIIDFQKGLMSDERTKEQIKFTMEYMSVDEDYLFYEFFLNYINKEQAKTLLFNILVGDPKYNWSKIDVATTQIPEAKDYHNYLIAEYGDRVVTNEKIIKQLIK